MLKNFRSGNDGKSISWDFENQTITKEYSFVVYSLNINDEYIVVVEPDNEFSPDNAVIFNSNGIERTRIKNPFKNDGAICFGDVYFVKGEIALVSITPRAHYLCIIDVDGNILRTHETR